MPAHTNRAAVREHYRVIRIGGDKPGAGEGRARAAVIRVRIEEGGSAIGTAATVKLDAPYREPDR